MNVKSRIIGAMIFNGFNTSGLISEIFNGPISAPSTQGAKVNAREISECYRQRFRNPKVFICTYGIHRTPPDSTVADNIVAYVLIN